MSLKLVGCRAHYVTPTNRVIPPQVSGVIIRGGDDIDPQHYGAHGDAGANYDAKRDRLEMTMVKNAIESGVPLLGICRGAQLINVVLGGTLHMDIRKQRKITPNKNSIFGIKWADLEPTSQMAGYLKREAIKINSLHNQAVNTISNHPVATAQDRDGFIQAFEKRAEHNHLPWIIGVQWHPEYMPYAIAQRRIFKTFAEAVRKTPNQLTEKHPLAH